LVDDVGTSVQNIIKNYKESHQRLVTCIKKLAPNRKWINDYFDLAKDLIEFTGLKSNDPRLVMSITKRGRIPITINQRYVLNPEYNGKIGLIMSLLERSKISRYKRFHEPIVYEAIMNISYRKRLLDEIFYDNV